MANKPSEIVSNALKMINEGYTYVYGAKGTKLSRTQIESLARMYPSVYTYTIKNLALGKIGKYMIDCSGFVCKAAGIGHIGSTQLINSATKKYAITDTAHMKNGMGLWHQGHVGILAKIDGTWYVLEAQSTATDLKKTPFSIRGKSFVYMFEIAGVDYTEKAITSKKETTTTTTAIKTVKVATSGSKLNCRAKASTLGKIVGKFANGAKLTVLDSTNDNWYKVEGISTNNTKIKGYVSTKYLKVCK